MKQAHRLTSIISYHLVVLMLYAGNAAAATTATIAPFEIDYNISRSGITVIHMQRRLIKLDNGEYRYESSSRPAPFIRWFIKDHIDEYSHWQFHLQQARPLHYHYLRSGGKKIKQVELIFDWQQGSVSDHQRHPVWSEKISAHTTDELLYQLQLMLDLQAGKKKFSYDIAVSGQIRHYVFTPSGTEKLRLAFGQFDTIKLKRNTKDHSTTIWFAPSLHYLPVRIEHQEKDGPRLRANATRIKGFGINTTIKK